MTASVFGGTVQDPVSEEAVLRYNTDGSLDPTFGTGGVVITDLNDAPAGASRCKPTARS
jgi:hypothetical protein